MLEVIGRGADPPELIVVAGLGRSAQWYRNVRAGHAVEVAIGRHRFVPASRELEAPEAEQVLADYERRHRWAAWLIRRVLTRLVGWTYDGSDDRRRRLIRELPMVAFRPADGATRRPGVQAGSATSSELGGSL